MTALLDTASWFAFYGSFILVLAIADRFDGDGHA
jgi:hypothetical protein